MLASKGQPNSEKWMTSEETTTWLAFNRRADLVLEPTGQKSARVYPRDLPDARISWQRHEPSLKRVEKDSVAPSSSTIAQQEPMVGVGN